MRRFSAPGLPGGLLLVAALLIAPCAEADEARAEAPRADAQSGVASGAPSAEPAKEPAAEPATRRYLVDRAVVRFSAPETGGRTQPLFIFERELAFEARLMALADPAHPAEAEPFRRHHVQAALERHVAESLLAALQMSPEPTAEEFSRQQQAARDQLVQQVGGEAALVEAARAEGMSSLGLRALLRRRARASLYLDRMVAPMLSPSVLELRRVHAETKTPFSDQPFELARPGLERWYVGRSLAQALGSYFQNARARLSLVYIGGRIQPPPSAAAGPATTGPSTIGPAGSAPAAAVGSSHVGPESPTPASESPKPSSRPARADDFDVGKPNPLTSEP
ncbi:MAG TPA: hypothetical protein VLC09_12105 [Polyangiaceae bacterium]|nr:hypothetical protein [Polyangiaceae bacterium]